MLKPIGVVLIVLGVIVGAVKRFCLTERSGVRTMQRLSPTKLFWQEKFPAYEIAIFLLIAGMVLVAI